MRIVSEKNIARASFLYAIITVTLLTFFTGGFFIFNKFKLLKNDLTTIEQSFIEEQKSQLKADIDGLISRIQSSREGFRAILKRQLESRVHEAHNTALNLVSTFHNMVDTSTLERMIAEAIRPVRFNNNQSYFFIIRLDGTSILHPIDPEQEGTNLLKSNDPNAVSIVSHFIRIAQQNGSGYANYMWPKPGDTSGALVEKTSYISIFKPLNWIIGTGEYLDNLDALAKKTITADLRNNLQTTDSDYFFAYELHNINGGKDFATMLINNNRQDLVGKKISDDYTDIKGKLFRKEFLKGIREHGEAYTVYWYKKPHSDDVGRKLAFFKLYPDWQWIVAKGIYFDRIDSIIAEKKGELSNKVKNDIILLCLIFLLAAAIALFVAYHYAGELQEIFDRYKRIQQKHTDKLEELNEVLKNQSRTDSLTGAFNRGHFNTVLSIEMARSIRYQSPLGLILFDIDHFKKVNDNHGHLAGDEVLKSISGLVQSNIRQTDTLARWGGEEFVLLAPGSDLSKAMMFAEKLRKIIASYSFPIDQTITCSFGVAAYREGEESAVVLGRADDNLYKAKRSGRNRCVAE